MTTRILPHAEWSKVAHTDFATFLPHAKPADTHIVVVEDGDRIVGCWGVLRITHLEGLWVHPDYRRRGSVARRLFTSTVMLARQFGAWAMTGAQTDDVRALLTKHMHAQKVDMDTFIVPLEGR